MAAHRKDLTGKQFGKLKAVEPISTNGKDWMWLFKCECGNTVERLGCTVTRAIKKGQTPSCGCIHHLKTHGLTNSFRNLQWVWVAMKQRCTNPDNKDYINYGGRGITICSEWLSFEIFHRWAVSEGYRKGLTIERIDVNGNYEPKNCTWVGNEKQALNLRRTVRFEYEGKMYRIRELAELSGIGYYTMKGRLMKGWSVERAVGEPSFIGKNQTFNKD